MGTKTLAAWKKDAKALCKKVGVECVIAEDASISDVEKYCAELQVELAKADEDLKKASEAKNPGAEFEYSIAPGKSITCVGAPKGMLHAGQEVTADMLSLPDLKRLIECGAVAHNPKATK